MTHHDITTIDLLRHGQTQMDDILRGRIDVALSDNGYQQMLQRVAPFISERLPWQQIISSPLIRCAQFARDLSAQHNTAMLIDDGFLEMDFGDWDGRSFDELKAEDPELFANIWRQPQHYQPPGGETFAGFSTRINNAWQKMLTQHAGKHILLICHGGVIRSLLGNVMQTPLSSLSRIEVPYACLSRIKIYQQAGSEHWPQLVFHNP
ncbi:histidine phosphatase family protein [Oceanicoccus sp. KOV_DT_Chl]|uniref:histidine phosphatase family protein n=1 Tax=Oceanicoccus sp. KOV_DT_Chl TaxID=1904639 RepID=UPI000C7E0257|nr:histidine phosphatase family protein [Oceanicoccus sp. KOV_DT_Chl]